MPIESVTSADGTRIAFRRAGDGPPMVLVHGLGGDKSSWVMCSPALERRFTLCAIDRRGRGRSADGPTYAIERDYEDVAAVVEAIGEPVHLVGHSYGGLCAMGAALRTERVRSLILYEPPAAGAEVVIDMAVERLERLRADGDLEAVVTYFFVAVALMQAREFDTLRSAPAAWKRLLRAAPTIPREARALSGFSLGASAFDTLRVPTLLLIGKDTPAPYRISVGMLRKALPHAALAVLDGQQHFANVFAPAVFAAEVLAFTEYH